MRFEVLRQRVERAEARVQRNIDRAKDRRSALRDAWSLGWTPPRIVIAGLVGGFLVGRAEPMARVGATRWLQLLGTVSGMVASIRAAAASETADAAAETAAEGAAMAEVAARAAPAQAAAAAEAAVAGTTPAAGMAGAGPAPARHDARSTAGHALAPAPAEAATELSER